MATREKHKRRSGKNNAKNEYARNQFFARTQYITQARSRARKK